MWLRYCLILPGFLSVAAVGSAQQQPVLMPGDAVRIIVWQEETYSGEFVIAADSTILHPLYQDVKIAGIPLPEVEQRLRVFLSRFHENPRFAIEPLFRVFVGGEVRQPSQYTVPPGTSLGDALVRAGWITERANPERVLLFRDGVKTTFDITDSGEALAGIFMRSGDRVAVERRRNLFREYVVPAVSFVGGVLGILRYYVR